jgi:ABC-type polysaccharide transport system permease subunit
MEKRVQFRSTWLPWLLIAPQLVVIVVFFFWPAAQAVLQSFQVQDAFGLSKEWVGFQNFLQLWNDESYLASFKTTAIFSILVAVLGIALSLMLAIFADRIIKGAMLYKTMLIIPYAVAPAVAGVLWIFMFSPSLGVVAYALGKIGTNWNHLLNGTHGMTLIVMAAVWKQISYNFLFFLAGLQSIPKSKRPPLMARSHGDGFGRFNSRCSRPPPSFCSSSTWSMRFLTPLRLSMPPPTAALGKIPRFWFTRSITTASRRWTWVALPRSLWC